MTTATTGGNHPPISTVIPPLLFGTATFNGQYNPDPYLLPTTALVQSALDRGIRAFDSSPYYGPAETLLGAALTSPVIRTSFPRTSYFISTKVGRISSNAFNYSPEWVTYSVRRSCERLGTTYLDLVLCHDVEFASSPSEVLAAVQTLRRLRDEEGRVRYVGISGYPVPVLCELAEMVKRETGEPLDAVMSYANFTLQNTTLGAGGVERFVAAGVQVVLNASPLGMGLLRSDGVPVGGMGDWHPSEKGLREACRRAAKYCAEVEGEKLENVALAFTFGEWRGKGGVPVGTTVQFEGEKPEEREPGKKYGVNVCGVSKIEELEGTMQIWKSVLGAEKGVREDVERREKVSKIAAKVRNILEEWADATWESPGKDFVRELPPKIEDGKSNA